MAKRKKSKRNRPTPVGASWWYDMISRREANSRLTKIASVGALMTTVGIVSSCGEEVERDSLEIQKELGWDAGSSGSSLVFDDAKLTDSRNSIDYAGYLQANALIDAWQPKSQKWKPFFVPTLIQSMTQEGLRKQIKPVFSDDMKTAYARGLGMRELILKSKDSPAMFILADLPGEESVAFAAAIADVAEPVLTFDNWPHPKAVVPAHRNLGAMVYYSGEVSEKSKQRPLDAPAVFVLDNERLGEYTDEYDIFDNRYVAKVPVAETLGMYGIKSVFYAVPDKDTKHELDDLNDDLVTYREKKIDVALLPMTDFQAGPTMASSALSRENQKAHLMAELLALSTGDSSLTPAAKLKKADSLSKALAKLSAPDSARVDTARAMLRSSAPATPVYHYGGSPVFWPIFFGNYGTSSTIGRSSTYRPPSSAPSKPSYEPVRRPTMFSSRTVGASATGVGKQKPTGFGRVSTSINKSGKITDVGPSSGYRSTGTSRSRPSTRSSPSRSSSSSGRSSYRSSGRSGSLGRSRSSSSS